MYKLLCCLLIGLVCSCMSLSQPKLDQYSQLNKVEPINKALETLIWYLSEPVVDPQLFESAMKEGAFLAQSSAVTELEKNQKKFELLKLKMSRKLLELSHVVVTDKLKLEALGHNADEVAQELKLRALVYLSKTNDVNYFYDFWRVLGDKDYLKDADVQKGALKIVALKKNMFLNNDEMAAMLLVKLLVLQEQHTLLEKEIVEELIAACKRPKVMPLTLGVPVDSESVKLDLVKLNDIIKAKKN